MSKPDGGVADVSAVATIDGKAKSAYLGRATLSDAGNLHFLMGGDPLFWRLHWLERVFLLKPIAPFDGRVIELATKFEGRPCGYAVALGPERLTVRLGRVWTTKPKENEKPRLRLPVEVWPLFWYDQTVTRRIIVALDGNAVDA